MKGRGLLLAAAVIQLVFAGLMLLSALSSLVMMPAIMSSLPSTTHNIGPSPGSIMRIAGLFYLLLAGFTTWTSIKLIQRRRWAWIVSLVMACLTGALMLVGMVGILLVGNAVSAPRSVGLGEAILIFIVASPIYVVIGLLIGGRHATVGAEAPRA